MKRLLFLLSLVMLFGFGCEEIGPEINPAMGPGGGPDTITPVDSQLRQVIVEEFTGVRCVNCPAGSDAIQNLINIHGEQLVAISIHAGSFAPPYNSSLYDFRTSEGDNLLSYLGEPLGYPTAVVNRKKFEGEFDLQLGQSQWAGYIAEELLGEPQIKIDIQPNYNSGTGQLKVDVTLYVQENILDEDIRLSVMITEDDIEDAQVTPDGLKADYKHKHVLRGMMTNYDGMPLTATLSEGAVIEENFDMTLPEAWIAENCHIIAVVSKNGEEKDVFQAHQVKLVE